MYSAVLSGQEQMYSKDKKYKAKAGSFHDHLHLMTFFRSFFLSFYLSFFLSFFHSIWHGLNTSNLNGLHLDC